MGFPAGAGSVFVFALALNSWQRDHMPTSKQRRAFEEGHRRKFLVIVDESPEVDAALFFAASRAAHTGGSLVLLYVIEPQDFQHWMGVKEIQKEEETQKAKALFRLMSRKLANAGLEEVECEDVIGEGAMADEILVVIEADEDISVMVLGAGTEAQGPGPLVSTLAAGNQAGTFPIPITIVPGNMVLEDIKTLA
ncbi:MAG: nucleotide-binding universal stress UspA family protein [Hyphomicrobiaceae bacterium]